MINAIDRVWDVIDHYRLHEGGAPVNLSPLEELCPVHYEDMSKLQLDGFCIATAPATVKRPAKVAVSTHLNRYNRRLIYAHEVAHGLLGHSGGFALKDLGDWFHDRQEREAWEMVAMMLIPPLDKVQLTEMSIDGLAHACRIPSWVVRMYL